MNDKYRTSYDAVIIGARCAGAATALALARQGLRVLAVDQGKYGSDTLSTLALMRGGVLQLDRWGILPTIEAAGTPAMRATSFHYGDEVINIKIKPRNGVSALYAPRRTRLDRFLVDFAREAGAHVAHGVRLVDLIRGADGRVSGVALQDPEAGDVRVSAEITIGADGARSTVGRLVNAKIQRSATNASGVVFGFFSGLEQEAFRWYFRPGVSAGFIPTNDGLTLVFAATSRRRFLDEIRFDLETGFHRVILECSPELSESVTRASRAGGFRGFAGMDGFLRQSHGRGWALVGDAGYFKDPITAHGITDALRDAELLARAVARGTEAALAEYQDTRDGLSQELFDITSAIAGYDWDIDSLKSMHLRMSDEMNREVEFLAGLQELARTA